MSTPPAELLKTHAEIRAALVKLYKITGAMLTYDSKTNVLYNDINRDLAVVRWRDLAGEVNVITAVTEHEVALLLASAFGRKGEDHQTPWRRYATAVMPAALVVRNDKPAEVLTHHAGREAQQLIGAVRELLDAVRREFGEPMSTTDLVSPTDPVSPTEPEQAP